MHNTRVEHADTPLSRLLGWGDQLGMARPYSVSVKLDGRVRRACIVEGLSRREAARGFGIDRKAVAKMLAHAVPPGYRHPHPDIADLFSPRRSLYLTTLGAALRRVQPARLADLVIEQQWVEEPRRLTEII